MSLLINLFSDEKIMKTVPRTVSFLPTRKCDIESDLSRYNDKTATDIYSMYHISSVLLNSRKTREYSTQFGKISDSHAEIEKLGVCKYCKKYTVIISMEDSLDYILHYISGSDFNVIYDKLENYQLLSRGVLNLNYDFLESFSIGCLTYLDKKLDSYLLKLFESDDLNLLLKNFYRDIIQISSQIVEYVFMAVKEKYGSELVPRSKTYSTIIGSSDIPINEEVTLVGIGKKAYKIKIKSFEKFEYSDRITESYRGI